MKKNCSSSFLVLILDLYIISTLAIFENINNRIAISKLSLRINIFDITS